MPNEASSSTDERPSSIDEAVEACTFLAGPHHARAKFVLSLAFLSFGVFLGLGFFFVLQNTMVRSDKPMSDAFIYLLFGTFITVFGVLMATYRFHLGEISRINHAQLGFMRIRVAARNSKPAFQTEVRKALTENAFTSLEGSGPSLLSKGKKIENPLPGHPASDLSTQVLNKIVEQLEISLKPKDG